MAEETANDNGITPRQRAARARRRADLARLRILELRNRRLGAVVSPALHLEDVRVAVDHAQQAHVSLIVALEASALAHELSSARYFEQAKGDRLLEEKARIHLTQAEADRVRARELTT